MTRRSPMTEADKAEVWRRRARGEPLGMIARQMGRDSRSVWGVVKATGGIRPRTPQRSRRELTDREREYSDSPQMQISPETIYVSLYVQGRGSLRAELTKHLRTQRTFRRAKNEIGRQGPKMLPDPILISQRPAEANDRAVPGHWEGDLLFGTPTTAVGTLVERSSRYLMLFVLARGPRAQAVREGIAASIVKLPLSLRRSLTWDQGAEMSQHQRFTVETGVAIYFCDPGR